MTRVPPHLRNTGMVFQNYALWPHLTVEKNVAFGLEERRIPKPEIDRRVTEALRVVQLEELARRKIHEMSGGQQQRVALARALVVRPTCLLLDEPLSNLDSKLRLEMRQEIRRICREFQLTSVYVTHDQQEALSIADRIAILQAGKLLQLGAPAEIYRHPLNRFVAEFIGEGNFLAGQIASRSEWLEVKLGLAASWSPRPTIQVPVSVPRSLFVCVRKFSESRKVSRLARPCEVSWSKLFTWVRWPNICFNARKIFLRLRRSTLDQRNSNRGGNISWGSNQKI